MKYDFELVSAVEPSPIAEMVAGTFDVDLAARQVTRVAGEAPGMDEDWRIGAIVGPSGSGKSQIARAAYGKAVVEQGDLKWPADKSVVEGMIDVPHCAPHRAPHGARSGARDGARGGARGDDLDQRLESAQRLLESVGFSSPPAWIRSYRELSNGQRFRCDLARVLMRCQGGDLVVMDEFTSVVDRQVAKVGAMCAAKVIRRSESGGRFVGVSCHFDWLEWAQPDWVLDMSSTPGRLAWGGLRRREVVALEVRRCRRDAWPLFKEHHYLSGELHKAAKCYGAWANGALCGFCATLQNFGHKGRRMIHRLVVLPDWQGLGVGLHLLDAVARVESVRDRISIRTSHPRLIGALERHAKWTMKDFKGGTSRQGSKKMRGSIGRVVASFEFSG